MKNTRKLIPALVMLLISAVLMSTASFAWFSMNREVTATGMEITAQSDNVWLAINGGASFDPANSETKFVSEVTGTKLYPVAVASGVTLTKDNVALATSWNFAYSNSTTSSTQTSGYKTFDQEDFGKYVSSETFSIGLSNISATETANNLKLKKVYLPANTGISIVVVCGSEVVSVNQAAIPVDDQVVEDGKLEVTLDEVISATVTKAGVAVTVYYYINGEDANVTTANIAALNGKVDLLFGVDEQ